MWKVVAISVVTLVVAAASSATAATTSLTQLEPRARAIGTPAFVGRWSRVTTCQEIVAMLKKAGLGAMAPAMLAGNGLVSGTPQQLAKKPNICAGARPRVHYHYFTKDGRFGSLDWNEEPVDDGRYRVVDARTFRIGQALFRYRVSGNQLAADPGDHGCREAAGTGQAAGLQHGGLAGSGCVPRTHLEAGALQRLVLTDSEESRPSHQILDALEDPRRPSRPTRCAAVARLHSACSGPEYANPPSTCPRSHAAPERLAHRTEHTPPRPPRPASPTAPATDDAPARTSECAGSRGFVFRCSRQ